MPLDALPSRPTMASLSDLMQQATTRRQRAEILAYALENLSDEHRYEHSFFYSDVTPEDAEALDFSPECRTAGCAAGLYCILAGGYSYREMMDLAGDIAEEATGLPFDRVFSSVAYGSYRVSPRMVAERIRSLLPKIED